MRLDHLLSREQDRFQKAQENRISQSYGAGVPESPSEPNLRVSGPRGSPAYLESRIATRRIYYDLIDSSILRYEIYLPICKYSKLHDDRRWGDPPSVCDTQTFKCLDTASRTVVREDI